MTRLWWLWWKYETLQSYKKDIKIHILYKKKSEECGGAKKLTMVTTYIDCRCTYVQTSDNTIVMVSFVFWNGKGDFDTFGCSVCPTYCWTHTQYYCTHTSIFQYIAKPIKGFPRGLITWKTSRHATASKYTCSHAAFYPKSCTTRVVRIFAWPAQISCLFTHAICNL